MGSHEMGMGTATVQAQVTADRLGLPMESVRFEYGDSDMPSGTMAGGSSQTASIVATVAARRGGAQRRAVEARRERLAALGPGYQ